MVAKWDSGERPCLVEADPTSRRTCGIASTYNNGPCRGVACTTAALQARRDYRARIRALRDARARQAREASRQKAD